MQHHLLKSVNLGKTYEGRRVVRDVNLEVSTGKIIGLLGPNGAGKTTTFYMLMGLVKPDYGDVFFDDYKITHFPIYRRARLGLGYLAQEPSIFRGLNVEENIMAILEVVEADKEIRLQKLESLLAEFSITHLRTAPSVALSGGERRRLEIARALATNPRFILLDEPFAGIDPIAVAEIKDLVLHLKDREIGVIITDHNVRDALSIIDESYIIHDGTVLMHGTPQEVVDNPEVRKVYLGERFSY